MQSIIKNISEEKIISNLEQCPHFGRCSQNLCPLDLELNLRSGREQDKCRYMRLPRRTKIKEREFITGGAVMPDTILNLVPESNLGRLNEASQKRRVE
jgi:hypothetical protein